MERRIEELIIGFGKMELDGDFVKSNEDMCLIGKVEERKGSKNGEIGRFVIKRRGEII